MAKALVAYFSVSGVTEKVAERLAQSAGADLFRIEPEVPYTQADLDWRNSASRNVQEKNDESSRPAIANKVADMGSYDVVFVGFPVWWYREPRIIDTFLESYDFAGKTIVPFATSGSSPMGETSKYLEKLASGAKVEAGQRFAANASADELGSWAKQWL